jgi:hypothetical protein
VSRYREERVVIIHEMTTEEVRNTEVNITRTRTARGRYGNPHIKYDVNDGLVDVILEVTPTEEQKAERIKDQKEKKNEQYLKKKNTKYGRNIDQEKRTTHEAHALNTQQLRLAVRTARAKSRQQLAATAMRPALHGSNRKKSNYTIRGILIQDLAGPVQQHRNISGPNGIYVGFHVLGGR